MAKVRANIVIHICSSIAWQAGAQPVSQPPAPGKEPQPMIRTACAYYWRQATHFLPFAKRATPSSGGTAAGACNLSLSTALFTKQRSEAASCAAVGREAEEDWFPVTKKQQSPTCGALCDA